MSTQDNTNQAANNEVKDQFDNTTQEVVSTPIVNPKGRTVCGALPSIGVGAKRNPKGGGPVSIIN